MTLLRPRTSRAELVARELEREIAEREPGDRLGTKDDLRRRFGVAVGTLGEAVRLLETQGLLEARPGPGGGLFVARATTRVSLSHTVLGFRWGSTTYAECLEARDALEPLICRHAARYHRDADIRALAKLVRTMAGQKDDPASFFETNWALHRRIARLCRNALLRGIYLTLIDFLETTQKEAEYADFDGQVAWEVHRELVAAIDRGEGPELARALTRHRPTAALI